MSYLPDTAALPQKLGLEPGLLAEAYVRLLPTARTETASLVAAGCCGSCAGGDDDPVDLLDQYDTPIGLDEGELVVLRRRVAQAIRTGPRQHARPLAALG